MRFTAKQELRRLKRERSALSLADPDIIRYREGGSLGRFFMGLVMMLAGAYMFLDAIQVVNHLSWGSSLFNVGNVKMTPGLVLMPFLFGIGMVFYNPDNDLGWLLVIATLIMITAGVLMNLQFRLRTMSSFELLMILGLAIGGIGLFLSGLRRT